MQVDHQAWVDRGIVGPFGALDAQTSAGIARDLRLQYASSGKTATLNRHADLPVLASLCQLPGIWQPAREILNSDDLLCWRTNLFMDIPRLPWHEDRHARLFSGEVFSLSVLLAVVESPADNCLVVVPGSHALTMNQKEERYGITATPMPGGNVRYRGEVATEHHERVTLGAGEMIVFHPNLLHASSAHLNDAARPTTKRMNIAFRVTTQGAELREQAFPDQDPITSRQSMIAVRFSPGNRS